MNLLSYLRHAAPSWWALLRAPRPHGRSAVLQTVWGHHSKRSGYRPVSEGLGVDLYGNRLKLLPGRMLRSVGDGDAQAAAQLAFALRRTRRDQLLVVDGDHQLAMIDHLKRQASVRVVAVFHQINSVLAPLAAECRPGMLDGAICVARCQIPLVERLAPPGRTWFIPHGVDTEYFRAGSGRSPQPTIVCVGRHCRDFATLRSAAAIIKSEVPEASVQLISAASALPPMRDLAPVELRIGLSDEALREAYQRAWVVLLPLTDATANNSLLEGLACGTPLVTTDVGGVRDYMGDECGALCPRGDAEAHARATIALLGDEARRMEAARAGRATALTFAWPEVRAAVRRVLDG